MTSQSGKQTSAIHILPNISRGKRYQTIKFGLLIGYNMRNIILEKSEQRSFSQTLFEKSKLSISLNQ